MKKKSLIAIIALVFIFTGCKKASELTQIRMPYTSQVTIPDQTPVLNIPYPVSTPPITTNTESVIQNSGSNINLVDRIYLEKLDLVLNKPSGGNLDFLDNIKIYIEADGLAKTLIAQKAVPKSPTNVTTISLDCIDVDLLEYFKKSEVKITSEITTDGVVVGEHVIDIKSVFMIDLNILGL
ncbi:MAG: hypothetical protein ACYC2P_05025 [Paludibacteraceae bacterium]